MKTHFHVLMAGIVLGAAAWAQDAQQVAPVVESKTVEVKEGSSSQEAALYQQIGDYLNDYRASKLGTVAEKQALIELTHRRVSLNGEIQVLRDQIKNVRKSKRKLYRADKKQDGFSDDYDAMVKEAQAKLDAKEKEMDQLVQNIEAQQLKVDAAKMNEISDKQFKKKMDAFRERGDLISKYQLNRATLKGEAAPAQNQDLQKLLAKKNEDLAKEYSQPREEVKPVELKPVQIQPLAIAKPNLSGVTIPKLDLKPIDVNAVIKKQQEESRCKDEALMAIAQGAITKNPRVLSDLFDISALKMAYALNESGSAKKSIEGSIQRLLKNTDVQKARENVTALYNWLGKDVDQEYVRRVTDGKSSYQSVKARLDNAHASSLILLLSKEGGSVTDFTEADAATVWAVERVRASQDQTKFAVGKYDGNLLNFSTKVYLMSQRGLTSDQVTQKINAKNQLVDNSFKSAFDSLSAEAKKCLNAGECKPIETLSGEQANAVRGLVLKLAQRAPAVENAGAHIDLANTRVEDGVITLSVTK